LRAQIAQPDVYTKNSKTQAQSRAWTYPILELTSKEIPGERGEVGFVECSTGAQHSTGGIGVLAPVL